MRSAFSARTRQQWAIERKRRHDAIECGEPDRPDLRAMYLAEGDIYDARAREAKVRRTARDARSREANALRSRAKKAEREHRYEQLKERQAAALVRGELTPKRAVEFRTARAALKPYPDASGEATF